MCTTRQVVTSFIPYTPARPRNRHRQVAGRCGRGRQNRRAAYRCHIISSHKHDYFTRYKAIQRISSQNPHLYERDIEKIVNTILDEIIEALRRGDRVELRGFGAFSAKLRRRARGVTPVPELSSQSHRKPLRRLLAEHQK